MLNLTRVIDRATGYVFVPPVDSEQPAGTIIDEQAGPSARPNIYGLLSSAIGPMKTPGSDIRDVQERWIDAKEEYDAFEKREWRKEGEMIRDMAARAGKIRERKGPTTSVADDSMEIS